MRRHIVLVRLIEVYRAFLLRPLLLSRNGVAFLTTIPAKNVVVPVERCRMGPMGWCAQILEVLACSCFDGAVESSLL